MTNSKHENAKTEATAEGTKAPHRAAKQLSKFFASFVGAAALCLTAYTASVDNLVQTAEVPGTYKWFLLKEIPGPRLIIESGSNSHHAIDTDAIGAALGMTAINIADNGGYALEDKLTRLETYTRSGDVVVLPLEWTFYHREKLTDNYVETIFTDNRDYYRSMPMGKRVKRALSLPPEKIIQELNRKDQRAAAETESPAKDLFVAALTQPTGHQSRETSIGPGLGVADQSCDDYILGTAKQRQQLKLGKNVKPALNRLKALKSRGVNIHFAWPVLAGDSCMSDPAYFDGFRTEIETAVNTAGFEFLNTPGQSLYGQEVQDDSPYHVTTKGTDSHTKKMVGFLKAQGYGVAGQAFDIKTFARHRLLELEIAASDITDQPALPIGQVIAMDDAQMRGHAHFTAGWWDFEPYGRWMRDNRALLTVTLPETAPQDAVLKIEGITKSGKAESVNVSVNGNLISNALFAGGSPLLIPTNGLPRGKPLPIFIDLPNGQTPQSPLERGENQDARTMTLHFQNLQLLAEAQNQPQPADIQAGAEIAPLIMDAAALETAGNMTRVFDTAYSADLLQKCLPADDYQTHMPASVKYTKGWWLPESTGRWMKGQEAQMQITLPEGITTASMDQEKASSRYTLTMSGDFFMDRAQTISVLIDGQKARTFKRAANGTLVATIRAPKNKDTVTLSLKLSGKTPQSPKALGLSQDERTLTYFLKDLNVSEA